MQGVSVTTRLVNLPADGQTLSLDWQALAYDTFISDKLLPSLASNLSSQGMLTLTGCSHRLWPVGACLRAHLLVSVRVAVHESTSMIA